MDEQIRIILEAIDKNVSATLSKVNTEMDKTEKTTKKSSDGLDDLANSLMSNLAPMALATTAAAALAAGFNFSVDAAAEAELAQARLSAVLTATGGAAGLTASELTGMADSLSRVSGVDDELITNAEAVMLTFRSIGEDVFPQAMQAALDMSAVMGTDLQSSVVMLGKALNDPIQGIGALRRVGVQLTDQQEAMVKAAMDANDVFGAQQIILKEMSSEFGGASEKMGGTYTGSVNKLQVALGNLGESIGNELLPQLTALTNDATNAIDAINDNWETVMKWADALETVYRAIMILSSGGISEWIRQLWHADDGQKQVAMSSDEMGDRFERMNKGAGDAADGMDAFTAATLATAEAAKKASDEYKSLLDATTKIAKADQDYATQSASLTEQRKKAEADLATARAQGWSDTSEKVTGYNEKLAEIDQKIAETAQKHNQATNQMIYDMTLAKLSVGGLTDAEFAMAQQMGVSLGIFTSSAAEQATKMNELTSAVANGKLSVDKLGAAIDMLPSGKTIDVILNILNAAIDQSDQRSAGENRGAGNKRAAGGPTYPGGTYIVGEQGPEILTMGSMGGFVTPNNALGGSNLVLNTYYSPMMSSADPNELQAALYPVFVAMLQRAQSDGMLK